jgi:hypothetical protein
MAEGAGHPRFLGYCTNVHSGETLERTLASLDRHAADVRELYSPGAPLGLGLWLSARAVEQVLEPGGLERLADWLAERELAVFTLNGFPYGDFHQPVVKHDVYRPDWRDPKRLEHTLRLARILARLVPPGLEGSISTLPLGWARSFAGPGEVEIAAANVRRAAAALHELHDETGRLIHVDFEPEPGCLLQGSRQVALFFRAHLWRGPDQDTIRRHLRVCHDICHSAVLFEGQAMALKRYRDAGVLVGKVQISSALRVRFLDPRAPACRAQLAEVERFAEPRYLHQTSVRNVQTRAWRLYEDLPRALAAAPAGEWRIHFHVPIYITRMGAVETTQPAIAYCLAALLNDPEVQHFEVETYAWDVLPEDARTMTLAESIARELRVSHEILDIAKAGR